jgi:DNA-binding YbaB/EbfC family protein
MFDQMLGRFADMQQRIEETKNKLEQIIVEGSSPSGLVNVEATASRKIKSININPTFLSSADKEELEDHLIMAINDALQQAENTWEKEMKNTAGNIFPGL